MTLPLQMAEVPLNGVDLSLYIGKQQFTLV